MLSPNMASRDRGGKGKKGNKKKKKEKENAPTILTRTAPSSFPEKKRNQDEFGVRPDPEWEKKKKKKARRPPRSHYPSGCDCRPKGGKKER